MQSETVGALAAALAKAQGAIKPAPLDRDNPFFKSRYATLASLWESARAALSANGLAVTQTTDFDDGRIVLITTLLHSSGEWIVSVYPVEPADRKPQALGSAITYARRYAFGALVGLSSAEEDDDGNAASNGANNAPHKQEPEAKHRTPPAAANHAPATGNASTNGGAAGNGSTPVIVDTRTLRHLHAVGGSLYGADWDAKRKEIVKAATKGRTDSSKALWQAEADYLIGRMEAKLQEQLAAISVESAPEMDPESLEVPA